MSMKKKINAKQDDVYAKDSDSSMPTNVSPHPIGTRRKVTFIRNGFIIRPKALLSASFCFGIPTPVACYSYVFCLQLCIVLTFYKILSNLVENA